MTMREPSYDARLRDAREMLAKARPDQIRRLIADIRDSGSATEPEETRRSA